MFDSGRTQKKKKKQRWTISSSTWYAVMPEPRGPGGGHCPPPSIYGRSVNPIPIGGGILSPHITSAPPPKLFTFRHPWYDSTRPDQSDWMILCSVMMSKFSFLPCRSADMLLYHSIQLPLEVTDRYNPLLRWYVLIVTGRA